MSPRLPLAVARAARMPALVLAVLVACALLLAPWHAGLAQVAELRDLRVWDGPENTRVVFDLTGDAGHRVFTLDDPHRVVVDLSDVDRGGFDPDSVAAQGLLKGARSARQPDGRLRVVLDLGGAVTVRSFALTPQGDYGHRVVLDMTPVAPVDNEPLAPPGATAAIAEKPTPGGTEPVSTPGSSATGTSAPAAVTPAPPARLEARDIIIAVDAGHGGEDPGAIGRSGLKEKDVALAIARRLARRINAEPGYQAVMIRKGDYYVGLRERVALARKAQADLFVSLHANAFKDARARGTAVYTLSPRGASSEQARWLAQRENQSDLIGGVELSGKEDTLAHVLLDISQSAAIEASVDAGNRVLQSLGKLNKLRGGEVQRANFMVLKAPDIPSMLVETAFITNPGEERKLGSAGFQERIAERVFEGIQSYFAHYRPLRYVATDGASQASAAARQHTVRRGDTLSEIAERYRVNQRRLREENGLSDDLLRVGQVLRIP